MVCLLLSLLMMLSLIGCNQEEKEVGEYQIYYLNMDRTKMVPEEYNSTGAKAEELILELLGRLQSAPESSQLRQTIPSNVGINGIYINGAYLYIDFTEEYKELSPTEEVLVRAAIVRTVLQSEACTLVNFTVNADPLLSHDGTLVGSMSADSFIENPGKQINSSVETTLTLYFASADGSSLVKETREVHYSTNISMEKLIMEQLIEGPKQSNAQATIPSNTKLISVSLVDGVCYVNLGESFKNQSGAVTEDLVVYSIVNSLTELPEVSKVQISVNGSTEGVVRYSYDLSKMYERNSALIGE